MADETILDLPVAPSVSGAEYIWLVQGGTDRRASAAQIASLATGTPFLATTVVQAGSTYVALPTDVLIIVQKTVGSPTTIDLPAFTSKAGFYYIKDGKGDAGTNAITVTPSGTDAIDGLTGTQLQITTNYGILQIAPDPLGGWVIINFG